MTADTQLFPAGSARSGREILLIKNGELALKGLNRGVFEEALVRNLKLALAPLGRWTFRKAQSAVFIQPEGGAPDMDAACERVSRVFGIAAYSRARVVDKDMAAILEAAGDYLADELSAAGTFKVEARRSDKSFPLASPDICREVGAFLLERYPHLRVDVHHPQTLVVVEIRDFGAYVHGAQRPGAGGMPVGTGGRAGLLISGGIDSPVAGYMMAKRGLRLYGVHFASPPYTSERAEMKVVSLMERVARYAGPMELAVVPFTRIQEAIKKGAPEELFTLLMRRSMMRIATAVTRRQGGGALITGESVGQVASQTMAALACTDAAAGLPVFRPLIGMDKEEIIAVARRIDTFDISIQPYDDCCTMFQPRHPRTRPTLVMADKAEEALALAGLEQEAADTVRRQVVGSGE